MFLTETLTPASNLPRPPDAGPDLARFPVVEMGSAYHAGYAFAWCAAMRRVLARHEPFILLDARTNAQGAEETEEDRRARRCWFASNAVLLHQLCRGYITVEPDIAQRCDARSTALALLGQPGLRVMVVSNVNVAQQLAVVLLKTDAQPSSRVGQATTRRRRLI